MAYHPIPPSEPKHGFQRGAFQKRPLELNDLGDADGLPGGGNLSENRSPTKCENHIDRTTSPVVVSFSFRLLDNRPRYATFRQPSVAFSAPGRFPRDVLHASRVGG